MTHPEYLHKFSLFFHFLLFIPFRNDMSLISSLSCFTFRRNEERKSSSARFLHTKNSSRRFPRDYTNNDFLWHRTVLNYCLAGESEGVRRRKRFVQRKCRDKTSSSKAPTSTEGREKISLRCAADPRRRISSDGERKSLQNKHSRMGNFPPRGWESTMNVEFLFLAHSQKCQKGRERNCAEWIMLWAWPWCLPISWIISCCVRGEKEKEMLSAYQNVIQTCSKIRGTKTH